MGITEPTNVFHV